MWYLEIIFKELARTKKKQPKPAKQEKVGQTNQWGYNKTSSIIMKFE